MRIDYAPFFRSTVGFDQLLDGLNQGSDATEGYPPYNIERRDENHYRIVLAVAGFSEKNLDIEVRDGVLLIEGKHQEEPEKSYLHQGIGTRSFRRQFQLAEHVHVKGAGLENGLLYIDLERLIPEEKKPRKIEIGSGSLRKA